MPKLSVVLGIAFLILAVVIFVLADGARRFYSGGFFAMLGIILLLNAKWRPTR